MENKFQDPIFGELVYEEKYGDWRCEVESYPSQTVAVNLSGNRAQQVLENIERYRQTFQNILQNELMARVFAADKLLKIYNESWRDEEGELALSEFCQRIRPRRIVIEEDQCADIYYDDDDLFLGHVINVRIDENGNFADAQIAG